MLSTLSCRLPGHYEVEKWYLGSCSRHVSHYLLVHAQNADGLQVWPHDIAAGSRRQQACRFAGPAEVDCDCTTSHAISR